MGAVGQSGIHVGAWPVPAALRGVPRAAYVGRLVERGLLERRGRGRAGGAGGVGVGRAGDREDPALGMRRTARGAEGFAVCWGACSEDLAGALGAVDRDLLAAGRARARRRARWVCGGARRRDRPAGTHLARRVPDAPAPQTDPETERFLLFKAVGELLLAVARSSRYAWCSMTSIGPRAVGGAAKHVARASSRAR